MLHDPRSSSCNFTANSSLSKSLRCCCCFPDQAPLDSYLKAIFGCYCILFIWLCGFGAGGSVAFKKLGEVGAFFGVAVVNWGS